jgi:signal transduction histidine kinase/ligand-binding sensor domain-containing protein/DNA-binding response OmpR family regulator
MKKILIGLAFIIVAFSLSGQMNTLQFKHYTVEDGLSQSWVQCILQDSLGFMWFGTDDGLNRFDGYKFRVYKHNPKDKNSLRNNSVNSIIQDSYNRLWVGTGLGLCKYDMERDRFIYDNRWPCQQVTCQIYKDNKIYIATTLGLYVLDPETGNCNHVRIDGNSLLEEENINSIVFDQNNNLWVGTLNGLFVISNDEKKLVHITQKFLPGKDIPSGEITSLYVDRNNRLWVGTMDEGLFLLLTDKDLKNVTFKRYRFSDNDKNGISKGSILTIYADKKNKLWIGVENSGLNILDLNSNFANPVFQHYIYDQRDAKSIASNSLYSFYEDFQGNMWIGTYGGGISFYTGIEENFKHFKHITNIDNSLINNNVNVFQEFDGDIWVGTEGGLSRFDRTSNTFKNYVHKTGNPGSLSANSVWAIEPVSSSELWIGTWSGGVNVFNVNHRSFSKISGDNIPGENIFSIYKDSKGEIWIGTMGAGLSLYDPATGKYTTYRTNLNNPGSIGNDWIRNIIETRRGELWLSTTESVEIFDRENEKFIHFFPNINDTTSLSGRGAYVIFEDSRSNLWFGTQTGLNYFKREDSTFSYYQENNGLPNNSVKGILEDDHGNLWLSTNKGISKMKRGIYLPEVPEFENFDVTDGLQGDEFNRRAAFKDEKGWMYFGGTNGFNVFHPDSIVRNDYIPPVVLTGFSVFNKPVDFNVKDSPLKKHISLAGEVVLKYNQSVFSFEFSALNYVHTEKNRYKYKLEGFDKDWNMIGTQRQATYTNLKPGNYVFVVEASNNDGVWNETGRSIKIKILPPWYRTNLAYVSYAIILLLMIMVFRHLVLMRVRLKHEIELKQIEKDKLDEVHQLKSRFFTNISHEFRTPLSLIISPLHKIISHHDFSDELKYQFGVILNNARRMLRLINQFLDISKMEAGYLKMKVHEGDLAKYIRTIAEMFMYQAEEKSIVFEIALSHDSYNAWFDSDKIEKILYNFISNAIKFTPEGGRIWLQVKFNPSDSTDAEFPGYVECRIKDNGIGIKKEDQEKIYDRFYQANDSKSASQSSTGIGLSLAAGLIEKYGGTLKIDSEYGKGAEFYFRLPVTKDKFNEASLVVKSEEEYMGRIKSEYQDTEESTNQDIRFTTTGYTAKSQSLLIVEDNDELRNYIKSHFKNIYKIVEASEGKSGYNMALENNPDIIISDIMMPEMDGIELTKLLKTDETTSHIPVILLTAKTSDETHVESLETGADAFLTKPFNITVLEARIKNLLEGRKKLKKLFSQSIQIEPTEISVTSVDAAFIQKAITLVEKNISDTEFNVYNLSKEMGVSRALLHRKLVALTDLPPSGFIKAMRLKRGAYLLVEGQKTVSEVIYEVGIKSRSYFTKSFKEMFGMSPTEYVDNELNKRNEENNPKNNTKQGIP